MSDIFAAFDDDLAESSAPETGADLQVMVFM
jgi:hypothetical protein